jgi:hypothetical protein
MRPSRVAVLRKPIAISQRARVGLSGSRARSSSSGIGSGTSRHSSTSRRLMRMFSRCWSSRSRRLLGFMLAIAAMTPSMSPCSWMSWAAFLGPTPGTPGTLSTLSPISACTSTTLAGGTPNLAMTSSAPIGFCLIGSSIATRPSMSCIRSLSDETIVVRNPAAVAAQA